MLLADVLVGNETSHEIAVAVHIHIIYFGNLFASYTVAVSYHGSKPTMRGLPICCAPNGISLDHHSHMEAVVETQFNGFVELSPENAVYRA